MLLLEEESHWKVSILHTTFKIFSKTFFNLWKQISGTVIIIANHGDRIDIPQGAILENKIVSGNLRILDH